MTQELSSKATTGSTGGVRDVCNGTVHDRLKKHEKDVIQDTANAVWACRVRSVLQCSSTLHDSRPHAAFGSRHAGGCSCHSGYLCLEVPWRLLRQNSAMSSKQHRPLLWRASKASQKNTTGCEWLKQLCQDNSQKPSNGFMTAWTMQTVCILWQHQIRKSLSQGYEVQPHFAFWFQHFGCRYSVTTSPPPPGPDKNIPQRCSRGNEGVQSAVPVT